MSKRIYRVVEKTPHATRYYSGGDTFTRAEGNSLEMTETAARNKAAELNERYASEAHWCRYDARPAQAQS